MKKRLMYSIVAMLSLSMAFTACNKDDAAPELGKEIAKKYTDAVVTSNGDAIAGGTIEIVEKEGNNITVILTDIVNGHGTFEVDAVVSASTKATTYHFVGAKNVEGMEVGVSGDVIDGKATVATTIKLTSAIVGKWGYSLEGASDVKNIFSFKIKNETDIFKYFFTEVSAEVYQGYMSEFISGLVTEMVKSLELELGSDGYVNVKGAYTLAFSLDEPNPDVDETPKPEPQKFEMKKLAKYYYNEKTGALTFDAMINIPGSPMNGGILPVPFVCHVNEENNLVATIGYEFLSPFITMLIPKDEVELDAMIKTIADLMPAEMAEMKDFVSIIIKEVMVNFRDATDYSFTLTLPKVK